MKSGNCNKTDVGKFVLRPGASTKSKNLIASKAIDLHNPGSLNYAIKKTGYYCVITDSASEDEYTAVVEFRNAYGELQATQIPKLPFYGGITILYALVAVYWGFLYYQHRNDIRESLFRPSESLWLTFCSGRAKLHHRHFDFPRSRDAPDLGVLRSVSLVRTLLISLLTFTDYQNRHGSSLGSKIFLTFVGILNAARNSFSFFLLLIVCMGYGVVKPTLGRTMIYVRWLAAAHFLFGLVYSVTSLAITPETAGTTLRDLNFVSAR